MTLCRLFTIFTSKQGSQIQKEDTVPETVRSFGADNAVQDELKEEKLKVSQLNERIRQLESELENLPLALAQAEIYQADFNAERKAREEIAGEKADLQEEIRRLKQLNEHRTAEVRFLVCLCFVF